MALAKTFKTTGGLNKILFRKKLLDSITVTIVALNETILSVTVSIEM